MNRDQIINEELPVVTEYNDLYESASIEEVQKRADNNDPVAIYELAYRYRCGEGGAVQNMSKAMDLYKRVLDYQQHTGALYRLGYAYLCGDMGEENREKCIAYFYTGVKLGDADSAVQLGLLYEDGVYIEKNDDEALNLFLFAIEKGRWDAYCYAGDIYRNKGLDETAVRCYQLALEHGNEAAALPLGWMYEDGIGVEKDVNKAFELYLRAYEDGDPDSVFYLGKMYDFGMGAEENEPKAFQLYKEAAELGDKKAHLYLGRMYGYGIEGVIDTDVNLAMEYLSDVSEGQETDAWYIKGAVYVSQNNMAEANAWLTKAAENGHKKAAEILKELLVSQQSTMIQAAMDLINKTEEGGIHKALEIIMKAEELYPDSLEVKEAYARILDIYGHVENKVGACESALASLRKCVAVIDILKQNYYKPGQIRELESNVCMECGEIAHKQKDDKLALQMYARTDLHRYPYAAVLTTLIHLRNQSEYARCIQNDITMIKQLVDVNNWRNSRERAMAYYVLSIIYANGVCSVLPENISEAYNYIQKCAEIDYSLAEDELRKYSKGLFGKIKYKN